MSVRADQLNTPQVLCTNAKGASQITVQEAFSDDSSVIQTVIPNEDEEPSREIFTKEKVEGLLAGDDHERVKRFCEKHHVTTIQALLAAFHAFLVRCMEEEGKRTYTIHERQVISAEDFSLELTNDISESFDALVQNLKSLDHRRLGSMASSGKCGLHAQELPSSNLWNLIITDDFALEIIDNSAKGLKLRLFYQSTAYRLEEIDRFMDNFLSFWSGIVVKSHLSPLTVSLCGSKELSKQRKSYWSEKTTPNAWDNITVIDRILEVARKYPQSTALITSDGGTLTYEGLVLYARKIAFSLQNAGASPGDLVGLLCLPGINEIAGMMGILMSRCGYVAMDPVFATERLSFIVNDSKATMVLVDPELTKLGTDLAEKSPLSPKIIQFPEPYSKSPGLDKSSASPQDPFYTIYTSGSTGFPKGVVLTQSNTQQMLSTLCQNYKFSRFDRFLHHSSMCFDLSIVEIFSALTCGAAVCIASAQIKGDPESLGHFMKQVSVTVTYFTPTKFALLLEACRESLQQCQDYRIAFLAGERLPARVAERFYNLRLRATMYNTWSPSELVVQTAIYTVPKDITGSMMNIPIGFPMANCAHYIVDTNLNPVPIGIIGEICVGGAQVGRGYINKPNERYEAFVQNPFASEDYIQNGWTKLFRTGDKGRFLSNGELEFHGRVAGDKQIKLRGLRMDLGEIEQRIFEASKNSRLVRLIDVTVVARSIQLGSIEEESITDDRQIIAFLVLAGDEKGLGRHGFVSAMHQTLQMHLNSYMLPNGYEVLEALPTTIGGKVDIRNLRNRELHLLFPSNKRLQEVEKATTEVCDRVADPILSTITDLFQTLLALGEDFRLAPDDNFFASGGQSMLLLRLQAKLKAIFGIKLSLPSLFKNPTPAAIAQLVRSQQPNTSAPTDNFTNVGNSQIDWQAETTLPQENEFIAPKSFKRLSPTEISTILVTGADSFIGVHIIATILTRAPSMIIYFIGSNQAITLADLKISLAKYQLLDDTWSSPWLRLVPIGGTLDEPHFGLNRQELINLGKALHAIYHIGGEVSLLKSYYDLKPCNVSPILTLISIAHHGSYLTEIHYLSTWSVPHLQTWHDTHCKESAISPREELADHFTPSTSPNQGGYLKARWANEVLLTRASERGFRVSIYRASAVTASSATKVPEPMYDLYRYTIMRMIQARCIPDTAALTSALPFAIDFIPVNFLASTLFRLSRPPPGALLPANKNGLNIPTIYHIGNPNPLSLRDLASLVPQSLAQGDVEAKVRVLLLDEWLLAIRSGLAAGEELRIAAIKDLFYAGHCSFALDKKNTATVLARMDQDDEVNKRKGQEVVDWVDCPPVDALYLRAMLESSW